MRFFKQRRAKCRKSESLRQETAELYSSQYKEFCMPQAVHKMLMHYHEVIERLPVPVGLFSEEAQECRNKDVKQFRESFTRKFSRVQANQDLLTRLLATSDPFIASLRRKSPKSKIAELPEETRKLLK